MFSVLFYLGDFQQEADQRFQWESRRGIQR
jgi:hypothetical protein